MRTQKPQRHGQIERRAFLANIRGSEIYGDTLWGGKIEAAILQRRLDSLAALFHRDIRQAYDREFALPACADVHLDFDEIRVDSEYRGA